MNLYSKYRSQKFKELVGQTHVVRVLTNAIILSRVGHAYLFSGPRGTGKTSIARILAKSLNCISRTKKEFEPCNKCSSCREITSGTSLDIIEIDAASNRGIDEIRELREKIRFAPTGKKYKIFIIDEVHMLTREAFNALLKTLEEPPAHAVFILATTELNKVPDTIISRTQSFDFRLFNLEEIEKRLSEIAKEEKIKIDAASINLIAMSAKGGLRDAITLLDQVSNLGEVNEKLTREILGLSSFDSIILFLKHLQTGNSQKLLAQVIELCENGVELGQFILEILEILRKSLIFKSGLERILDVFTKEERNAISEFSKVISEERLIFYIEKLLKAYEETKHTSIAELPLELAIFAMLDQKQAKNQIISEIKPVKDIKKTVSFESKVDIVDNSKHSIDHSSTDQVPDKKSPAKLQKKIPESPGPIQNNQIKNNIKISDFKNKWITFTKSLSKTNNSLAILLRESEVKEAKGDSISVSVQFKFYKDRLSSKKIYDEICEQLKSFFQVPILPKFIVDENLQKSTKNNIEKNRIAENDLVSEAMEVFG